MASQCYDIRYLVYADLKPITLNEAVCKAREPVLFAEHILVTVIVEPRKTSTP